MQDVNLVQIALELWGAIILLLCLLTSFFGREHEPRRSWLVIWMLFACAMLLSYDALAYMFRGDSSSSGYFMVRLSNFVVFALMPTLGILAAFYVYEITAERRWKRWWLLATVSVGSIHILLLVISLVTNFLYSFDANNIYHREGGFIIVSILGMVTLVLLAVAVIATRKDMGKYEFLSMMLYVLLPSAANLVQLLYYGLSLNSLATAISIMMIFLTYQAEKSQRLVNQKSALMEKELYIAKQQADLAMMQAKVAETQNQIMLSQIRPHFMFNVLGSIEQLCYIDPERAADATGHFARYLRGNLDALGETSTVSFADELRHIRHYVWLEQVRFGEDLQFVEEVEASAFLVPTLSVQPIVENAIKHGLRGLDSGVLTVRLSARELSDGYEIVISDNGMGFDPAVAPPGKHVGLQNVRERIALVCKGQLLIDSKVGSGTKVTIKIPKEQA